MVDNLELEGWKRDRRHSPLWDGAGWACLVLLFALVAGVSCAWLFGGAA